MIIALTLVDFGGNHLSLVSSFGSAGEMSMHENGGIYFSNPTAGLTFLEYGDYVAEGGGGNLLKDLTDITGCASTIVTAGEMPDGTTVRTGAKVEFEGKPIEGITNQGVSKEGMAKQTIGVANTSDGDKLFTFVKEQTGSDQEWSILDYKMENMENSKSIISTSGQRETETKGPEVAEQFTNISKTQIERFDHNHPQSETSHQSSDDDQSARDLVTKNNKNAQVKIHYMENKKWTSRSIKNDDKNFRSGEFN